MPNNSFKEEQRFRNPGLIALLLLLTTLVLYRTALVLAGGITAFDAVATGIIALCLGAGWYMVYATRLRIKIGKKYLKLKTKGPIGSRLKLRKADMEDCSFVEVTPSARWAGALADPTSDFLSIDFGGRGGLCVRMRDGKCYFIGSDDLFQRRHEVSLPTHAQAS